MNDPGSPCPTDGDSAFAAEVASFREDLGTSRSSVFLQLFDFLVERSGDNRAPKEVEIALAIFGRSGGQSNLPDSAVRVAIHRLRKRLDDFYKGKPGARLHIPKGEYRLVLSPGPATPDAVFRPSWRQTLRQRRAAFRWAALIVCVVVANGIAWWLIAPQHLAGRQAQGLGGTTFWRAMTPDAPTSIIIGDSYMLAETENRKDIERLILEPGIRTREDFGGYLTTHPEAFYKLYDLDLYYAPVGTATATWDLLPALSDMLSEKGIRPRLISSSRLKAPVLESSDIVYVGALSSLGVLAAPVFQSSGFSMAPTENALVDRSSGRRYVADIGVAEDRQSRVDFGYIASLPGPAGKHIFIIAGIGDAAVQSMAKLASDPAQLDQLTGHVKPTSPFEALYEVRTMGSVVFGRTLITVRPLRLSDAGRGRPTRE